MRVNSLVGIVERFFKRVISYNSPEIFRRIVYPICNSLENPSGEIKALQNLFDRIYDLSKKPFPLNIPEGMNNYRIYSGRLTLETFWTHSKAVRYSIPGSNRMIGAETSDIIFQVNHELIKPNALTLIDEKISYFQAKIEKKAIFAIKPKQWYLMRYWPDFNYKNQLYSLKSSRRVPDVCSFYLLLARSIGICYRYEIGDPLLEEYFTNSFSLSTVFMENCLLRLKNLSSNDIVKNNNVNLRLTPRETDSFIDVLWLLLNTELGVTDVEASTMLNSMFIHAAANPGNPGPSEHPNKRPKIGIRLKVQLKSE
jgi:hypothetical protein